MAKWKNDTPDTMQAYQMLPHFKECLSRDIGCGVGDEHEECVNKCCRLEVSSNIFQLSATKHACHDITFTIETGINTYCSSALLIFFLNSLCNLV